MGVRKQHKIPADASYRLRKNLRLARDAAWELSNTPWFRNHPEAKEAFNAIFQLICESQRIHSAHSETVLKASEPKKEAT